MCQSNAPSRSAVKTAEQALRREPLRRPRSRGWMSRCCAIALMHVCGQVFVCGIAAQRLPAQSSSTESARADTQYVLLNNDRVISGNVVLRGESVIVRRGGESELTLRVDRVLAVAPDLPALFAARARTQRRPSVPSIQHLLADTRWCIDQGLAAQAAELLMRVYAISPQHPVALQLESRLRRTATAYRELTESSAAEPLATDPTAVKNILPVSHSVEEGSLESIGGELPVSVTAASAPASLHWFTAKVQPILISRCAKCHHEQADVPTNWNLALPPGGSLRVTQRGSIANLEATLRLCNPSRPEASELIARAMQDHSRAGAKATRSDADSPPIREHEMALLRTMVDWISGLPDQSLPALQSHGSREDGDDFRPETSGPLSPIAATDAALSLHRPPAMLPPLSQPSTSSELITSDPLAFTADVSFGGQPDERRSHFRAAPQGTASRTQPTRLPIVENPNDVHHFNRETQLRRQLGLEHEP